MKQKLFVLLAALFIGAALMGLAGWGLSRPAAASPERGEFERQSHAVSKSHDSRKSEKGERGFSRYDVGDDEREDHDGDYESDDREGTYSGGSTSTSGTTVTTAGTTVTTQAPTTSTTSINAALLFSSNCASCHGSGGRPIRTTLSAQILATITTGSMKDYASSLTSAELSALANYIAAGGR